MNPNRIKLSKVFEDQGNRDCFKYKKLQFLKIWLLGHPVQFVFSTVKSALPVLWSLSFRFWALVKTMGKHTRELSYWHFVHIYEISDYRILNITRGHKMWKSDIWRLRGSFVLINIVLTCFLGLCFTSCPFQVPFGFLDDPLIQPVLDEFGNTMADQVRVDTRIIANKWLLMELMILSTYVNSNVVIQ